VCRQGYIHCKNITIFKRVRESVNNLQCFLLQGRSEKTFKNTQNVYSSDGGRLPMVYDSMNSKSYCCVGPTGYMQVIYYRVLFTEQAEQDQDHRRWPPAHLSMPCQPQVTALCSKHRLPIYNARVCLSSAVKIPLESRSFSPAEAPTHVLYFIIIAKGIHGYFDLCLY
jgi:hypothetical protein